MFRTMTLCLIMLLMATATATAEDKTGNAPKAAQEKSAAEAAKDAKELSGMSIVGNDEAPKSLYIVPWKSSEIGVETSLHSALNEKDVPVDRDVFMRQLDFYRVSTAKN